MSKEYREYRTIVMWKRVSPSMNIDNNLSSSTQYPQLISSNDVLQIQFNLYMSSPDRKFGNSHTEPRVLTLRRDKLPLLSNSEENLKVLFSKVMTRFCDLVKQYLLKPFTSYDPDSATNMFSGKFGNSHTEPRVLTLRRDELPPLSNSEENLKVLFNKVMTRFCDLVKQYLLKPFTSYDPDSATNMFSGHGKLDFVTNRITEVLKSMPLAEEEHPTIVAEIFDALPAMPKDVNFIFMDVDIYDPTNSRPATKSAIEDELEEVRLHRSCGICMDEFEKDVIATRLPCLHIFHGHCILRWLETDHKCPLCRDFMPHVDVDDDYIRHLRYDPIVVVCQNSYRVEAEWKTCPPAVSSDMLQIQFNLYKSKQNGVLGRDGEVIRFKPDFVPQLLTTIHNHRGEQLQPTMITQVLQSMRVPRHEQQPIVAKIFEVVANSNKIDDGAYINADIYDETLELLDYWGFGVWLERVRWESHAVGLDREELETYKPRVKRASKSAIEDLERVRFDRSCGICMDDFEDGFIATRFPCLHIFHGHCILSWLGNHHNYCPMCRYPVPAS